MRAVAAEVSSSVRNASFVITNVLGENEFEFRRLGQTIQNMDQFWPADCNLTGEQKRDLYFQITRCFACQDLASELALTCKNLVDHCVRLVFEDALAENMFGLSTGAVDVSDLVGKAPVLVDPGSGHKFLALSTFASMASSRQVSRTVTWPFDPPEAAEEGMMDPSLLSEEEQSHMPHWWFPCASGLGHVSCERYPLACP